MIFDVGGVLEINPRTGWEQRWAARLGLEADELVARLQPVSREGEIGAITLPEVELETMRLLGLDRPALRAFMDERWAEYLGRLNVELARYFARLRPRYRTCILSNSFVGAREREQEAYGFEDMCDVVVYSHEEGVKKPDPAIYEIACRRLGVRPCEAIFLDDTPACVEGARRVGVTAIAFRDNAQALGALERLLGACDAARVDHGLAPAVRACLTYVGGPTAVVEWHGLRLITDPTFDPAGSTYELPGYTLRKLEGPAVGADELGPVDAVLLSHDHHFDNLDRAGRALLARAGRVLTTPVGAERLASGAVGLAPWEWADLRAPGGDVVRVTATPARHGPEHGDRGPVVGFVLTSASAPDQAVYFSGDTVWYDGVREVLDRFPVTVALLCLGAARVRAAGEEPLTFTAQEAVEAARAMPTAAIVPLHFEGWEHFSESRADVEREFSRAGIAHRLCWPVAGQRTDI